MVEEDKSNEFCKLLLENFEMDEKYFIYPDGYTKKEREYQKL